MAHPPIRGVSWLFRRPRSHAGFLRAWLANGFNKIVVDRVVQILQDRKPSESCADAPRILITGGPLPRAASCLEPGKWRNKRGHVQKILQSELHLVNGSSENAHFLFLYLPRSCNACLDHTATSACDFQPDHGACLLW